MVNKSQVDPAPKLYSIGAVAKLTGVTDRSASKWADKGMLKAFRIPGSRHRRVYEDDLVKFLLEHDMRVPADMLARWHAARGVRGGMSP